VWWIPDNLIWITVSDLKRLDPDPNRLFWYASAKFQIHNIDYEPYGKQKDKEFGDHMTKT
jgi:hypothetical protein